MGLLTIAKKNLKNNYSFYSFYFVSVAFVLMVFFSFISFSMNDMIMEKISSDGRVETMSRTVAIFVMTFVLFYMSYSNTFFMKKRMKELGIYSLLGYRKSTMLKLLTFENIIICFAALIVGIAFGALTHKGIVEAIVRILKLQIDISEVPLINPDAVLFTFVFIFAVLTVLFLSNWIILRKSSLLTLVRMEKKEEKKVEINTSFSLLGLFLILIGYFLAIDITRGTKSLWKTIGFSPIALLTMLSVILGTIFFIHSFLPLNILLIDDHALFAKSLEIALEDYPEIDHFYSLQNIEQVMAFINEFKPNITLIDINLSNISNEDGLGVAKHILDSKCDTKIVILTGYDLPVYRYEAQKIGVSGFINKNIMPDKLLQILIEINKGICYFPMSTDYVEELTNSEKQILQLLCDGYKRKEISSILFVSERTVSNHIQHIFDKLDVSSSLEAVTRGIKLGYIQPNYKDS